MWRHGGTSLNYLEIAMSDAFRFRFPKYYPQEWLRAVNEKHIYYTIELRKKDGMFTTQTDIHPNVYHHPSKDLAVLHIAVESETVKFLSELSVNIFDLATPEEARDNSQVNKSHESL